jgi:F-type H+-transporting ATPase subunit epsilon
VASFHFKILTPHEMALDEQVVSIVVPAVDGYLGVLAHHIPLITTMTLKADTLKVSFEGKAEKWFKVSGGVLKVKRNEVVVLTETVEEIEPE